MGNVDEEILKQREAMEEFERQRFSKETIEKEKQQSIFDSEIEINKIPVRFAERKLIEDKISIWMPEDFEALSQETIDAIYLLGNKPDMVFGNSYLTFSVGFHYTEHKVPNEYMGDFLKVTKLILEKSGPKVKIMAEKVRQTGRHTVSCIELISHSITDTVYNYMFFSSLEDRVLIGFINFNIKYQERYRPIAEEMIQSFRFPDDEKESGDE